MEKEFLPIKNIIEKNIPDFMVRSAAKLGEGSMSKVFEINGEWAFRFAKNQKCSHDLEKEINVLPLLKTVVSLNIPEFKFTGKQENGLYFVGYKMLPGVLLEEDSVLTLSEGEKQRLIISLSKFMTQMQSISPSLVQINGVPIINLKSVFKELYKDSKDKVFPLIDNDTRHYLSMRFEEYLNNGEFHSYTPMFIHGDLSPDHFLVDSATKHLTGIIDFGDMAICDPDYEYLYILEDCGESFTRDLLKLRGHTCIEKSLEKISLFVTFDHLNYIIEGIDRGINEWIVEGLKEIKLEMNKYRNKNSSC